MPRTVSRKFILLIAATLLVGTAGLAAPQTAQAITGVPCYGHSCVGLSPITWDATKKFTCLTGAYNPYSGTWVGAAYTVNGASVTISLPTAHLYATVVLRYSPYCHSNWARVDVDTDPEGGSVKFWVMTADGNSSEHAEDNGSNYTTMVDGTQTARICAQAVPDPADGSPGPVCSGWF